MFKLFLKFNTKEKLIILLLAGFVVLQVWVDVTIPEYTGRIMRAMSPNPIDPYAPYGTSEILRQGGLMLALTVASFVCTMIIAYIGAALAANFGATLRRDVFHKVQKFSFQEMNKFSPASLITRSTNDVQNIRVAVFMILRAAISAPVTIIWASVRISETSPTLTWVTVGWILGFMLVVGVLIIFVLPKLKVIQKVLDRMNLVTRENLTGLRVVKSYNAEVYQGKKFEKTNEDLRKINTYVHKMYGLFWPIILFVIHGIVLSIYWIGAHLVDGELGARGLDTLAEFHQLAMQIFMAFMMLIMVFVMLPRALVSAKRIREVLDTKEAITDPEVPFEFKKENEGEVEFKKVSFKYPDAENYILEDISFKVKKGQTVAFVGSTGSGKSTLINLVPRFYDVTDGEILVSGVDIRNVRQHDLRGKIGYVPQKGVLFSGTVSDNIAYGAEEITQDIIERASKVACAHDFVVERNGQYESKVAQGGKNVSGGQKQRLSIARAVAINPEFYIFDDSFSALDYKTDKLVRENLRDYTSNSTVLIVAQRIGTVLDADKIIVLEKGMMVGEGNHKELMQSCEVYTEIALSQLTEEELEKGGDK
ncbi:MAG: ABC transporter ATP-binding protein/permease [Firmicutes bacterium]|nr:ABC transporter ATP-binding protein/permease [Bacillota bacterium]